MHVRVNSFLVLPSPFHQEQGLERRSNRARAFARLPWGEGELELPWDIGLCSQTEEDRGALIHYTKRKLVSDRKGRMVVMAESVLRRLMVVCACVPYPTHYVYETQAVSGLLWPVKLQFLSESILPAAR